MYVMWRSGASGSTLSLDMAHDASPPSDPGRLVSLLWRERAEPGRRGRPSRLDAEGVVAAAVALADAQGLPGLTMRSLATALQASPMALYTHVGSRGDLLALMLDRVCGAMPRRPGPFDSWRERVAAMARDNRDLQLRHPWIVDLPATRPPPGPGLAAKYDRDLAALDGLGLGSLGMDQTLAALLDLAAGSARQAAAAGAARRESGLGDVEWWALHAPFLDRVFDPAAFPVAARVGPAAAEASGGAYDPDAAFEAGLALMLDGLERRVAPEGASGGAGDAPRP